ncbi:Ni/Fe-hydrogenase, b-type cytochrome subunit, partial [Nitriliruptoraceae bacterium ZYF776]|nr:Ni/Fe-hydrogenase, b-type cytochrome subunit [Profundirhabdus halotolerans]MTV29229.1 Ni/Fe-hydrogenase, b-type cytochrome subunit [Profundirhabdus halotolerans]
IYLAIFNSVYGKSGAMDSIISGYKWEDDKK